MVSLRIPSGVIFFLLFDDGKGWVGFLEERDGGRSGGGLGRHY